MFKLVLLICLSLLSIGCSSLDLQRPTARITGMDVRDVDPQGFTMNFAVDLQNPNARALPLADIDYKLDLAGASIASGDVKPGKTIPANATQALTVPVRLTYANLIDAGSAISRGGWNIPYKLAGGVGVDTGMPLLGQMRVPLEYSGELPLKKLLSDPVTLLRSPEARKLAELLAQRALGTGQGQ